MAVEVGIWRIDKTLTPVEHSGLDLESRLQEILCTDISIADPNLMVIGREVPTDYGKRIDILAMNRDGHLVVLELKRDKTPREIVAQTLEYGAWIRGLENDEIAQIYSRYHTKYLDDTHEESIDGAFREAFNMAEMPDELNESHQLMIVASALDAQTERIVNYLAEEHGVSFNAVFFRVFKDDGREYLTRAFLREPGAVDLGDDDPKRTRSTREWNGEYYCSFGHDDSREGRVWDEAVKYGFFSAGGGEWYTKTLALLSEGDRIWANVPGFGYVGVGRVKEPAVAVDDFLVEDESGNMVPIQTVCANTEKMGRHADDPEKAEYMVRVEWLQTVPVNKAIKEKGFFGNQNSVARPKSAKWDFTIERLKKRFGVD